MMGEQIGKKAWKQNGSRRKGALVLLLLFGAASLTMTGCKDSGQKKGGQETAPVLVMEESLVEVLEEPGDGEIQEVQDASESQEGKAPEAQEETEAETELKTEPKTEPETEAGKAGIPVNVHAEVDGRFFCYDGSGQAYILDEDGRVICRMPEAVGFSTFPDDRFSIAGYCMARDGSLITLDGEKVFSMEEGEYDRIEMADTLDAGYLILAKDVNTFAETGTHYFAYNVEDGTSFQFEKDACPTQKYWHYFGNGNFIYAPPGNGFGSEQMVYHLQTNETIPASVVYGDGQTEAVLPDIHYWKTYNYDDHALYGILEDENGKNCRMVYRFDTGQVELHSLEEASGYETVWYSGETPLDCVVLMYGGERYVEEHPFLLDYTTGVCTPMDDYHDFALYMQKDGAYLCKVENEGGGEFFTVIEPDGVRRFEPIPLHNDHLDQMSECYGVIIDWDDDIITVYDWDGNCMGVIENNPYHSAYGRYTIVYNETDSRGNVENTKLFDARTGETKEIAAVKDEEETRLYLASSTESCGDGYFIGRAAAVLSEEGDFRIMQAYEED